MLVAYCAQDKSINSQLDPRFGRCSYFILADSEKGEELEVIPNQSSSASGGSGPQSAQLMAEKNVNAVVAGNFGPNAVKALKAAGITIYTAKEMSIKEAITKFQHNELQKVDDATVESHHGI